MYNIGFLLQPRSLIKNKCEIMQKNLINFIFLCGQKKNRLQNVKCTRRKKLVSVGEYIYIPWAYIRWMLWHDLAMCDKWGKCVSKKICYSFWTNLQFI